MTIGRALIVFGLILAAVGALVEFAPALRIGRLPGDISFGGSSWRVYVPIGTSILLSILLALIFAFLNFIASRK
jgi:hypothetical protein